MIDDFPIDPAPPTEAEPLEQPRSRWPTVIGVISLIYAILGMLCGTAWILSTMLSETLMRMGGMTISTPAALKLLVAVLGTALLGLGVLMIVGATSLLRRRRSGVQLLKTWAILRLIVALLGVGGTILLGSTSVDFQRSMIEAENKTMRDAGRPEKNIPSDQELWRTMVIQTAVMTSLVSVYPLFLGIYLSRRRITEEVQQWL